MFVLHRPNLIGKKTCNCKSKDTVKVDNIYNQLKQCEPLLWQILKIPKHRSDNSS